MANVMALTTDGGDTGLKGEALEGLSGRLRGPLLTPELDGYEEARHVWNGMIDRRPALIGRCTGTADVKACVEFAREHGLLVSVKGGGHNFAGKGVWDGAFMIDLSLMRSIHVDTERRRARAGGGAKWGDFDNETQAFGLATTGGTNTDTGIAGLTLGGGIGWLAGRYGLTCDNLLSANVVLADGRVVTAGPTENEDLFWGLRGGSGNFGIVTSFEYQLHPVDGVLAGPVFHPLPAAADALRFYAGFVPGHPRRARHRPRRYSIRPKASRSPGSSDAGTGRSTPVSGCSGRCGSSARRWPTRSSRCRTVRSRRRSIRLSRPAAAST